ncbi:hypothetical protein [Kitasatospora sp. NPDC058478]|uniref:hypothetical protein n=1 Tax=unclassified Kitasatospora TaxID=2633591 RepID=UPI003653A69F
MDNHDRIFEHVSYYALVHGDSIRIPSIDHAGTFRNWSPVPYTFSHLTVSGDTLTVHLAEPSPSGAHELPPIAGTVRIAYGVRRLIDQGQPLADTVETLSSTPMASPALRAYADLLALVADGSLIAPHSVHIGIDQLKIMIRPESIDQWVAWTKALNAPSGIGVVHSAEGSCAVSEGACFGVTVEISGWNVPGLLAAALREA